MSRLAVIFCASALLAACAGPGPYSGALYPGAPVPAARPGAPGPEVTYQCDDLTAVTVQYGLNQAVATLNSGFELTLPLQRIGSGFFATPTHSFQVRSGDGLWAVAPRPPVLCRIKR